MASQPTTTTKRAPRKTAATTALPARPKADPAPTASTNGDTPARTTRRKPLREMTLEELSLRAYKMTYERLHGSKKKKM